MLYFLYCECVLYENSYSILLSLNYHYKSIKACAYCGALKKLHHESCGLNTLTVIMQCVCLCLLCNAFKVVLYLLHIFIVL